MPQRFSAFLSTGPGITTMVGGIFAAVGIIITAVFLIAGGDPLAGQKLKDRGVATEATIIQVDHDPSTRINGIHPWLVRYYFFDNKEQRIESSYRTMDTNFVMPLQSGQTLSIIYDREDPTLSMPANEEPPGNIFGWFLLIPGAFVLLGLGLIIGAAWPILRRLRPLNVP